MKWQETWKMIYTCASHRLIYKSLSYETVAVDSFSWLGGSNNSIFTLSMFFLSFLPSDLEELLSELDFPVWWECMLSFGKSCPPNFDGSFSFLGWELLSFVLDDIEHWDTSLKSSLKPSFSSVILDNTICFGFSFSLWCIKHCIWILPPSLPVCLSLDGDTMNWTLFSGFVTIASVRSRSIRAAASALFLLHEFLASCITSKFDLCRSNGGMRKNSSPASNIATPAKMNPAWSDLWVVFK